MYTESRYSSCGGKTDTFPMLTIFDSMHLHNLSFGLYMNSSCGLPGQVRNPHLILAILTYSSPNPHLSFT